MRATCKHFYCIIIVLGFLTSTALCEEATSEEADEIIIGLDQFTLIGEGDGKAREYPSDGMIVFNGNVRIGNESGYPWNYVPLELHFRDKVIVYGDVHIGYDQCFFDEGLVVFGNCYGGSGINVDEIAVIKGVYRALRKGVTKIDSSVWVVRGPIQITWSRIEANSIHCGKGIRSQVGVGLKGDITCFEFGIDTTWDIQIGGNCYVNAFLPNRNILVGRSITVGGDLDCIGNIYAWEGDLSVGGDLYCSERVTTGREVVVVGESEVLGKITKNIAPE